MIPLMKSAFLDEYATKQRLAEFIMQAPRLSMDLKCAEFERAFAAYQGSRDAVLFNSGGSANLALLQALKNLGRLKDGDRVGFSALTWSTNVMPIIQMGLVPVAVDCTAATLNVMSAQLRERMDQVKLAAFFTTNALGLAGDLHAIRELCRSRGTLLLEDNCEALGTELQGVKTGNFGLASTFSFFVAHHMSTIEGGMICTSDEELSEMLRIVRANGWDRNLTAAQQFKWRKRHSVSSELYAKYTFYDLGYNLRPTEITGFIGLLQLAHLPRNIRRREEIFLRLEEVLKQNDELVPLDHAHISVVSGFAFPVICRTPELRERYVRQCAGAGVELRPMIAGNIQRQPFYAKYVKERFPLPGSDLVHDCGFYFGCYPELTEIDIETLCGCLRKY